MHLHNNTTIPPKVLRRHYILSLVAHEYLTLEQAAQKLDLSYRHTKRLWQRYRQSNGDVKILLPQPKPKKPYVLTKRAKEKIVELYEQQPEINCYHLTHKLQKQGLSISRESVRKVLKTLKQQRSNKSHRSKPSKRFEASSFGQIVQMDTCQGAWLKGAGYQYLILCLDDYSRFVVGARIYATDSTWTNMCVIRDVIEQWGLPEILYTDNASHFRITRYEKLRPWNEPEQHQTRIQCALAELRITHVAHHPFNPRAKGKIERFFRFIQNRCLQHNTARNLAELNYQVYEWIKWYNHEHVNRTTKQKPCERLSPSVFRSLPAEVDLDQIFVVKETRKVRKDNGISFRGKQYRIPEEYHVAGQTVEIHIMDTWISIYFQGKFLTKLAIK